ncbi:response regulator [Corallococcus exiguus]|uniref:Response regulator n=2 Tax=Corallococcus TaxID=83461 RepID=A0A410S1I6_CORCK|nr:MULTISPECIES: response regulator [Corallococcus]NBC45876.1 response regulator [Corallococcus exiguus]NNB95375.1 response regulator [Corallococcus exiguus]NNC07061.1 response regulator [Corallococcus exiguus]NNC17154.1 response regulator [Corallococcus exiguus]NRD46381.1 response regulator [Corallococcus exiguus]
MTAPTVLISDDEPLVVSALAREAKRSGLVCVSDTTSEHVLELARKHRPAVIILDINQHQDGRDLLAQLKKDPVTRDCKVIMLSGVEDQFTRHVCFELGADDYEVKPCDPTFMTRIARMAAAAVRPPASPEAA